MSKFIIQGEHKLQGEFTPRGAKNAALKMMAAAAMADGKTILRNVPDLTDIVNMTKILNSLGVFITRYENTLEIDPRTVSNENPDYAAIRKFRGSVVIIGPMLALFGKISLPQPGGCVIGVRSIDTHLHAFEAMGAKIKEEGDLYHIECEELHGSYIVLEEASVTATENVLMAATLAKGITTIKNAAMEPEISDLAKMLNKMGAKIQGIGTATLIIEGIKKLKGTNWSILPDRIEIGTMAIAGAITKGELIINPVIPEHLDLPLLKLKQANVNYELEKNFDGSHKLIIKKSTRFYPFKIDTRAYPGFPTDLQAPMSVLATQASGTSTIFESMFESRLNYARELNRMGSKICLENSREAIIHGPTSLKGKKIVSPDLRAGATLLLAALIAQGESEINQVEIIDRGYEAIDERINALGGKIERIN